MRTLCILLVAGLSGCALAQEPGFAPLATGTTPLSDIGLARVGWQSYGGQPQLMPSGWVGHFTTETGISYWPDQQMLGRDAFLLHSPWRVPPGRTWVDFPVKLPNAKPITLSFGITMSPEAMEPDKSDGVTFSAALVVDGTTRDLMKQQYAKPEWKDYRFDLSEYAGRNVTVRLQVEPGPQNSPSFDFSYFGNAQLVCGQATDLRQARLDRIANSRAVKATADTSLVKAANDPTRGVVPSNLLPCTTSVAKDAGGYAFTYKGADADIVYRWQPTTGTLDDVTVQVDGGRVLQPAAGGGAQVLAADGKAMLPAAGGTGSEAVVDAAAKTVKLTWTYPAAARSLHITWTLGLVGKALTVRAESTEPLVTSFSLGSLAGATLRRTVAVPYFAGNISHLAAELLYHNRYLDWTVSHSSVCPQGIAEYHPKTDGTRNPLLEQGFVTVSALPAEVLPNLPSPPSPYMDVLGPRIMLDIWGHHDNSYAGDAANLRDLKDNGVDNVVIIQHDWQRYGYDVKLPDHIPANPSYGGDPGMAEFGRAANEAGYRWSVHENYIDLYPDAPSYDPAARVLQQDGKPSAAWYNPGTKQQSFGLKSNRALGYAKQNSPEIHRRYGTSAAYLDVHPCVPPWHQLDHEAGQPMAAMELAKVQNDTALFQYMRDTHQGPLFGEGANHMYWAGRVDGVEAQVNGGEDHEPMLDFDLLKLHPQMVNHGMGYYERWYRRGYSHELGIDSGSMEQLDKYRAMEIAYGHAGFVGASMIDNVWFVTREHHLLNAVQKLYGTAKVAGIDYEVNGKFVSLAAALAVNETRRQRIRYDNGLTVHVNWSDQPWAVEGRRLPQWGWLARGPKTEAGTILQGDKVIDWVESPEYLFADARTSVNMPYAKGPAKIEPKLKSLKDLGGGEVEVTYTWTVGEDVTKDLMAFVHGLNDASVNNADIEFQGDHALPRPTNTWRAGETIVDGPHRLTIPATFDHYDLVMGLYNQAVGRVGLTGLDAGGQRILLGRLKVTRDGQKVTAVALLPPAETPADKALQRADFTKHVNPAGTRADLGLVATDGAVKINRGARQLVVFPYPRDKEFGVSLDLAGIAGGTANPREVTVQALAAGTQAPLAMVTTTADGKRVSFRTSVKGAGRYVVKW